MSGVEIRVRSNSRQAQRDLGRLEKSVGRIERTTTGLNTAFRRLAIGIGAAFAGTAITKGINGATDSLTNLENRISLVTGRGKAMNNQLNSLYKIAKDTRSPIDATVETYNRFGIALKDAGKSAEAVNKAITSVGLATSISGGSAESTRAALFQLGQGLASGQLRGQELNSVLEQAPRLARVISDAMEVPFGSLRKLAEQGKITTDVVFEALLSQSEKLAKEFELVEQTSNQALSVLRDQIGRVTGEVSKQLGITAAFTSRINKITDAIEGNRSSLVSGIVGAGRAFADTFTGIISVGRGLARIISAIFNRALDAIPKVITPFRDFGQVIQLNVAGAFLFASAALRRFGLDVEAIFARITDTKFSGAIRSIFNSSNLKEFGDNLYTLGEVIDRYGKRWYNFGNIGEKVLRSLNVALYETGIFLGIIDRSLLRLRYTSFERFGKASAVLGKAFKEIKRNILATELVVALQIQIRKLGQFFVAVGDAINKSFGGSLSKVFKRVNTTMLGIYDVTVKYLSQTVNYVKTALEFIERKFFWLYNEVIGNSWWTDTMEGIYDRALEFLPKTTRAVSDFGSKVSEIFKRVFDNFSSSNFSSEGLSVTVSKVKIRAGAAKEAAFGMGQELADVISISIRKSFTTIREISPQIASFISLGIAAALTKAVSPSLFKKTFAKLGPLLFISVFTAVAAAFDGALLRSGVFEEVARGLGNAIGQGINTIITNIPKILRTLLSVANAFGKGLAESIGNSIIGLPAQILSFLPGGGLLTTILYGGLAAAVFFKKIRTALIGFVKTSLTSIGAARGTGMLYDLFVGSNPANTSKQIIGASKAQMGGLAAGLARQNKRRGIASLAGLASYVVGAELLLGDLIGTTGAAIVGIGASLVQSAILGDPKKLAFIVGTFNSILAAAMTRISSLNLMARGQSIIGALIGNTAAGSTSLLSKIGSMNMRTTRGFATSWRTGTKKATNSVGRFSKFSLKRLGKIGLIAGVVTTAFAGMASAGTGAETALSGGFGLAALAVLSFGDTILSYAIPALGKLLGMLGKLRFVSVITAALSGFATTLVTTLVTGFSLAIGGLIAAIPAMIIGLVAAIVAVTAGALSIALFGTGDSFKEKTKNVFDDIGARFNLLGKDLSDVRKKMVKDLRMIESDLGKGFKINLSSKLADANISDADDKDLLKIERAVKTLDKNRDKAEKERIRYGEISQETRKDIEAAARAVETAVYAVNDTDSRSASQGAAGLASLSDQFSSAIRLVKPFKLSDLLPSFMKADLEGVDLVRQNLLKDINAGKFTAERLDTPAIAEAFATALLEADLRLPDALTATLEEIRFGGGVIDSDVGAQLNELAMNDSTFFNSLKDLFSRTSAGARLAALDNNSDSQLELGDATFLRTTLRSIQSMQTGRAALEPRMSEILGGEVSGLAFANIDMGEMRTLRLMQSRLERDEREIFQGNDLERINFSQGSASAALDSMLRGVDEGLIQAYGSRLKQFEEAVISLTNVEIDKGAITDVNRQLEDIGISSSLNLQNFNDTESYAIIQRINDSLKQRKVLETELFNIQQNTELQDRDRITSIDFQNDAILAQDQHLRHLVDLSNQLGLSETNRISLLQEAMSSVDDLTFDINDILTLDAITLKKLIDAQEEVGRLSLLMQRLSEANNMNGIIEGLSAKEIAASSKKFQKVIEEILKGTGKGISTSSETIFEKLVGGLNDSNFAFDLAKASSLSTRSILTIEGALKKVEVAQKKIIKSSLADSRSRKDALKIIKDQRAVIFDQLTRGGTVEQAQIGFESMGMDPNLLFESERVKELSLDIINLQEELNSLGANDLENQQRINDLLDKRRQQVENLTVRAEAATDSIQNSFAEGFKTLIKGQSTIANFFNTILDSISNQIIDTVVDSFTEAFFKAASLKSTFDKLFENLFEFDWGSAISKAISFIPFSNGGIVPNTSMSRVGQDSVPAMLTPGELVVPTDKVNSYLNGNSKGNSSVVNLSITGDISRQTRQEIIKMLPAIASGVNSQNKESNYKG